MTDLVLVNPNNRTPAPFAAIEPPLWLGLMAGHHLQIGENTAIIDAEAEGLTVEETAARVNVLHPKETIIVVMGANPSVSSTPKMPVTEELLKRFPARLTGIHPIAVNYPSDTIHKPFDGFPFVPWYLLPMEKYRAHNWHCLDDLDKRSPYGVLYTSLNCPFDCDYCNIHALYPGHRDVRYRPFGDIYEDLSYFANNHIKNIKIWDELFCLDQERVLSICGYILNFDLDFNIWAYARVDTVTEKMLAKMKQAGINWLAYGFESAQEDVRQKSNKKFSDSQAKRAIDMTRDAGINIIANFLFGLPGETEDDMRASLDMAMRENFEYVNFNVALPYPGSEWYASLKLKPTDWSSFSQFSPSICADPAVVRFRDGAFQAYFNRPEYLSMIKTKFGEKAEEHIKEMLKWKIR